MLGRLLLCTYEFPPAIGPRSVRLYNLSSCLAEDGWQVDVLTALHSGAYKRLDEDSAISTELHPHITVHRTPALPFQQIGKPQRSKTPGSRSHSSRGLSIPTAVGEVARSLLIPDPAVLWLPGAARRAATLVKQHTYTAVWSSGYPHTGHILGYLASARSKRPLIMEYGDPWAFNPAVDSPRWRRFIDRALESRILRHATAVVLTNPGTRAEYLQKYPFLRSERVFSIASGYNPREYNQRTPPPDKFRVVYTGMFYASIRSPKALLAAFALLKDTDIELVIAGPISPATQEATERLNCPNIHLLGHVPRAEAIRLQTEATMLVLLGNSSPTLVPLKAYEYLGARRPVLYVRQSDADTTADMLVKQKVCRVVENTPEAIAASLRECHSRWSHGRLDSDFDLSMKHSFTWSGAATQYEVALSSLANQAESVTP